MMERLKMRHFALFALLVGLGFLGAFFFLQQEQKDSAVIRAYDHEKDFAPLYKLINDNKYWIAENPADFSPEKVLIARAPSSDPHRKGQVNIDVVEAEQQTAGFIAFYKKSAEHGMLWLLAVDKTFRGRGFGEMLVGHALANLKKQGARTVTLYVRTINKPALSLYKKMGFTEQHRDEERGMVTLVRRNL